MVRHAFRVPTRIVLPISFYYPRSVEERRKKEGRADHSWKKVYPSADRELYVACILLVPS